MLNVIIIVYLLTILVFSGSSSNFKEIVHAGYCFGNTGFTVTLWIVHWTLDQTSGLGIGSSLTLDSHRCLTTQSAIVKFVQANPVLCCSIKYPYPSHGRFLSLNTPPLRKFHFSVILSFKKLGF